MAYFHFSILYCFHPSCCNAIANKKKLYIVYMGDRPQQDESLSTKHHSMLHALLGSASSAKDSLVYSYERSFNGFAAKLTKEEAARVSEMEGVVSVNPSRKYELHTTRSWDFLNLTSNSVRSPYESNVIIGLLDTGVWPEHSCFDDVGLGPPPAKWKGICTRNNFTCNKKIIGARSYNSYDDFYSGDISSPRDTEGHGTHTASTASGIEVEESYYGLASGIVRGGVPGARIAVYKVCWEFGCLSVDILKAFDDAIADGVDIISVSLGSPWPEDYFNDAIAIGSFHAMRNGILTSSSAGNSGADPATVSNFAPWILTVGASTIDRKFVARMALGDGQIFTGIAINSFDLNGKTYPLIWGGEAANYTAGFCPDIARDCKYGSMNAEKVAGKIVYCDSHSDGSGVLAANGAGIIMTDVVPEYRDVAFSWPLPSTLISRKDANGVLDYIRSTENPVATIFYSEVWKDVMAPVVASFSSRGPSPVSPDILKPDITAPGVDILAGWSPMSSSSLYDGDKRTTHFNIISGTSMSCPHASGAAAYVKSIHPKWSPAAIKSALMTTAHVMDPLKHRDLEFAYGSGQINPVAATDPGLVFDASEDDYINFLCRQGYNAATLKLVTGHKSACADILTGRAWDLNYPSFSLYVGDGEKIEATFTRTATNVGPKTSTYRVSFNMPASISVTVRPSIMTFSETGQTRTFTVTVAGPAISQQPIVSGAITWTDGIHVVRTPLVVYNYIARAPYNIQSMSGESNTLEVSSMYKKIGRNGKRAKLRQ